MQGKIRGRKASGNSRKPFKINYNHNSKFVPRSSVVNKGLDQPQQEESTEKNTTLQRGKRIRAIVDRGSKRRGVSRSQDPVHTKASSIAIARKVIIENSRPLIKKAEEEEVSAALLKELEKLGMTYQELQNLDLDDLTREVEYLDNERMKVARESEEIRMRQAGLGKSYFDQIKQQDELKKELADMNKELDHIGRDFIEKKKELAVLEEDVRRKELKLEEIRQENNSNGMDPNDSRDAELELIYSTFRTQLDSIQNMIPMFLMDLPNHNLASTIRVRVNRNQGDQSHTQSGLSESEFNALRNLTYNPSIHHLPTDSCSICYYNFVTEEVLVRLHCSHVLHRRCLEGWARNNRGCPSCSAEMT